MMIFALKMMTVVFKMGQSRTMGSNHSRHLQMCRQKRGSAGIICINLGNAFPASESSFVEYSPFIHRPPTDRPLWECKRFLNDLRVFLFVTAAQGSSSACATYKCATYKYATYKCATYSMRRKIKFLVAAK